MFGDIVRDTGWEVDRVGEMTLAELADLRTSWETSPPTHLLISAYLGATKEKPKRATRESMAEMAKLLGG